MDVLLDTDAGIAAKNNDVTTLDDNVDAVREMFCGSRSGSTHILTKIS